MSEPVGRREAHKQATRSALLAAAERLFAERGYETTTIRDVAREAKVTERTVYRYFDGKEGLLAGQALAWIEGLRIAVADRPADEPALVAVYAALRALSGQAATALTPSRAARSVAGPRPLELLQRATPRPLRKLEDAITAGLLERTRPGSRSTLDPDLEARLAARVAVAALRTAANQLHTPKPPDSPAPTDVERALADSFAMLAQITGALAHTEPKHTPRPTRNTP